MWEQDAGISRSIKTAISTELIGKLGHKGLGFFPQSWTACSHGCTPTALQYYTYYLPFLWQQSHTAVWASQPFPQHSFGTWSAFCAAFRLLKDLSPDGTTWCFPMDSTQHRIEFNEISARLDPRRFSHKTFQRNSSIFCEGTGIWCFPSSLLYS